MYQVGMLIIIQTNKYTAYIYIYNVSTPFLYRCYTIFLVELLLCVCVCVYIYKGEGKGKVIPLQARCGPEGG